MPDQPTISVTGTGRVSRAPDMATITAGITLARRSVDDATAEAATLAARLIEALKSSGVADDDLQTSNFSVSPEYDHRRTPRALVGYRVTNTVTARILDLAAIGSLLNAATGAGGDAITIDHLVFDHTDPTAMLAEARRLAWTEAEDAARQLAALAGQRLGPATRIEEGADTSFGGPPTFRAAAMAESVQPIESGTVERAVTLHVRFELVSAEGVAS